MASLPKRTITRNRELLACSECRRRKLKCDRHIPCTSCAKRGDEISCTYQRSNNSLELERERRLQAEARLEHLEQLVRELSQDKYGSIPNGTTRFGHAFDQQMDQEVSSLEFGVSVSEEPVFSGSTHWSAMLEDIEGLKSAMVDSEAALVDDDIMDYGDNIPASLILGSAKPLPLQQVLFQYLPPRQETDRLIAAYFRNRVVSAPFIHASQFKRLYQAFWEDPLKVPTLWISILFSICHVAKTTLTSKNTMTLGHQNDHPDDNFITASAQCLALGEYFRPKRFSVESLLLFVHASCVTRLETTTDLGLILSMVIRLATSIGYHRDPQHLPLSAFEKEMRRRTWSLCIQLDLLISFQLGLPSNIQFPTWDTQPPRNLRDSDFDEDTNELPPARPDSEPTDILFYIAKHKLTAVFEKVLRHTLSTEVNQPTNVDELDTEIRNTYSALPEILRPRLMADSVVDPPVLIVTRLCVSFMYYKCLCVLHRPYVARGRASSFKSCHEAASSIVRYISDANKEFRPGGQLETERWFMGSITWQDYLLGLMALCMVVCASSQSMTPFNEEVAETIQLLRDAIDVCADSSRRSKDTGRVQKVVNATLLRFQSDKRHTNGSADNGSVISDDTLKFASMQPPFESNGVGSQNTNWMLPFDTQNTLPEQVHPNNGLEIASPKPMDDISWAYLEQFLNIPDDDPMSST